MGIVEKAVLTVVETGNGEGEIIGGTVIMGYLCVTLEARTDANVYI